MEVLSGLLLGVAATSAGGSLALAATLLIVDFPGRLNRALATALALYGVGFAGITASAYLGTGTPELYALRRLAVVCLVADPYAFLAFALVYRDRFMGSSSARWGVPIVGVLALVHVGALLAGAWPGVTGVARALVSGVSTPIVGAILVLDAAAATQSRRRRALLLGALGFSFASVAIALHSLVPYVMGPVWTKETVLYLVGLIPLAYACWRLHVAAREAEARADARRFFAVLMLAPASVVFLAILVVVAPLSVAVAAMSIIMAAWGATRVALVGYAVLRAELFGLDATVKRGISRGTVAGIFLLVFFVVAQLAQNLLTDSLGWAVGGLAAGALLFAIAPIQRLAERIASSAMPGVRESSKLTEGERAAVYREQARAAWEDGVLTRDERRLLDVARERLGISDEEAARIEREVMAS